MEVWRASGEPVGDDERLTLVMPDFLAARARTLKVPGADSLASDPRDLQVREAALAWVRGRRDLAAAAFAAPGAARWSRSEASVAGCQTGPGLR